MRQTHSVHTVASNPTNLRAVQDSPTSISVSWTPPSPLGVTTGYRISYSASNDSGIESIDGGDRASHRLSGLNNGDTYTISILSTATGGLPNTTPVQAEPVGIGKSGTMQPTHMKSGV